MIKQVPDLVALGELSDQWMTSMEQRLNSITDWSKKRAAEFQVHRATRSVDVIKSPLYRDFYRQIEFAPAYELFAEDIQSLSNALEDRIPFLKPRIVRFLFVRLPAHCDVDPHRDFGPGLMVGARIHLPIVTHEQVRFKVGQTDAHLDRGVLYEINNSRMHAVSNAGDADRIHAIFDICDMCQVEDQVRYVMGQGKDDSADSPTDHSSPLPAGEVSLRYCSGEVQQRLSQQPLPIHLFVLCPNNSGSTLLAQYLARCRNVVSLPREGQFMDCFEGPNPVSMNVRHLFTEKEDTFRDPSQYNWHAIKDGWSLHWESQGNKPIRLEKSPTDIARAEILRLQFPNARFILQVRNPYATAEGIARRTEIRDFRRIGRHVFRSLEIQLENSARFKDIGEAVRYEDICEQPDKVQRRLKRFLPQLDDLDFSKVLQIKDYHQPLDNLNDQQISRLTREELDQINESFDEDIMNHLGYAKL